jgi:hypothetical protein
MQKQPQRRSSSSRIILPLLAMPCSPLNLKNSLENSSEHLLTPILCVVGCDIFVCFRCNSLKMPAAPRTRGGGPKKCTRMLLLRMPLLYMIYLSVAGEGAAAVDTNTKPANPGSNGTGPVLSLPVPFSCEL